MTLTIEQVVGYLGVFFGTALGAFFVYRAKYNKEPAIDNRKVAEDLVITSGVIGDMKPVRDAAAHLERVADLMEKAIEEMRYTRHVWEKIHHRMETNAEVARASEHRSHRQEDRS